MPSLLRLALAVTLFATPALADMPATQPTFANGDGTAWLDAAGERINAHGGGLLLHDGVWHWYGEARKPRERPDERWPATLGVSCYTSTDLKTWTNAGLALEVLDDAPADHPFRRGTTLERPKIVRNPRTGKFVLWWHLELPGKGYAAARAAVAVADAPTGPFTYVASVRPNAGAWPVDFPEALRTPIDGDECGALFKADWRRAMADGAYVRRDFEGGQMSRDMTLFVDPADGRGYLLTSAEENYTLHLHELDDEMTGFTGRWQRFMPGGHNEAPAVARVGDKYHLLASGCTGWDPNAARSYVADSIWGPWKPTGNPCVGANPANGMGPDKTFGGQSTFLQPLPDGRLVAGFDVWHPKHLYESAYLWLPARIDGDGELVVEWRDAWRP